MKPNTYSLKKINNINKCLARLSKKENINYQYQKWKKKYH